MFADPYLRPLPESFGIYHHEQQPTVIVKFLHSCGQASVDTADGTHGISGRYRSHPIRSRTHCCR